MSRDLLFLGCGGFGRETAALAELLGAHGAPWRPAGFLDDDPARAGTTVAGLPVLGRCADASRHADVALLICPANARHPDVRLRLAKQLSLPDARYPTLIHPSVALTPSARLGAGTVVHAHVAFTVDVSVGRHVAIMPGVTLPHDVRVGDGVTLAAGVRLSGGVVVEDGAYIGAGALVRENVIIGAGAVIGMGSVVLRPVPAGEVWAGVPARRLRSSP